MPEEIKPEEQTSEAERKKTLARRSKLLQAEGQLVTLRKTSPKGEKMYASVRNITVGTEEAPHIEFENRFSSLAGIDSIVLMDVFAEDAGLDDGLRPIAHRDWFIEKGIAHSGGNLRVALIS